MTTDFCCTGRHKTTVNTLPEDVLKSFIAVEQMTASMHLTPMLATVVMRHGTHWYTYAKNGDKAYLHHLAVSSSNFSAKTELLSGKTCITSHCQLLFGIAYSSFINPDDEDNISTALEHPDHVIVVDIFATNSRLTKMAVLMQMPFPCLSAIFLRP